VLSIKNNIKHKLWKQQSKPQQLTAPAAPATSVSADLIAHAVLNRICGRRERDTLEESVHEEDKRKTRTNTNHNNNNSF
jgi:hypothetical protein